MTYFVDYYGDHKHQDFNCSELGDTRWQHKPNLGLSQKTNAAEKDECPECWQ